MKQSILVNNTEIEIANVGGEKYVAIKPICEAIGVDFSSQLKKVKEDEILSSVMVSSTTTGADRKEYKMNVLPLKFVFGWLFTINPSNVNPAVKADIIRYRLECYNALYDSFTKRHTILQEKTKYQLEIEKLEEDLKQDERYKRIQELKGSVKDASTRLNALDKGVVNEQLDLFKK